MPDIEVLPDPQAVAEAVARKFIRLSVDAIAERDCFAVALCGGSTPHRLHTLLGERFYSKQVPWSRVHLFWGDERCVPPFHPDSNYGSTYDVLLDRVMVPVDNIHNIRVEFGPDLAATKYIEEINSLFHRQDFPHFDLILLGMGEDGHTASLFPGSPALREENQWVVAVEHDTPPPPLVKRITMTLPLINAARQVIFMVTGAAKAERLKQVLSEPQKQDPLPAQLVKPANGKLTWMIDREAAGN